VKVAEVDDQVNVVGLLDREYAIDVAGQPWNL
jgi:hypothetical protein